VAHLDLSRTRGGKWFQGEFILGAARTIYLWGALLAFVGLLGALLVAVILQLVIWSPVSQVAVPPEPNAQIQPIDVGIVQASLSPPSNIHFVTTLDPVTEPVTADSIVGYFDASTPNGLAPFPNDFDILGGRDAEMFDRVEIQIPNNGNSRAGLRPTEALVDQIRNILSQIRTTKTETYRLSVVARDRFGLRSTPTDVVVNLTFAPPAAPTAPSPENQQGMTALQQLARDIARRLDPNETPAYFDAYNRALKEPSTCGTDDQDSNFVTNYREAFDQVRNRLSPSNIDAFYAGVCAAWHLAVQQAQNAQAAQNAARNEAIAKNIELREEASIKDFAAQAGKWTALSFAGLALGAFLTISLSLAFLTIENHSRALREAVQKLAQRSEP